MSNSSSHPPPRRSIYFLLLWATTFLLALAALVIPLIVPSSDSGLQIGQVAPEDIRAPRAVTFESEALTEQQREAAERTVPPIYTPPDTSVARNQLDRLRSSLAFINSVRADSFSDQEQKLEDLAALEDVPMRQELASKILELSEARWQAVQQEAIIVLEQVMRSTIRDDHVEEVRRSLPAMVSLSLTEEQAQIVAELVSAFVTPNSFYSESLTEAARQNARQAVPSVTRSFKPGETIVLRGRVLTAVDIEALEAFGLVQPSYGWKDLVSIALLVFLAVTFIFFYLRRKKSLAQEPRSLLLIAVLFLVFLSSARFSIPGHTIIPYVFPIAAYGMLVASLISVETALITLLPLAVLVAYGLPNEVELILFYALSASFGLLTLGRAQRIMSYFLAGMAVTGSGAVIVIASRLPYPSSDWVGMVTLSGAALFNGIASAGITILLQYYLAQFLGTTTSLQLMEISRPDHPLLQLLLRNAPGTYQHSLQVANLAEQAAERIGADTLLTRVGAQIHDVGKAVNPPYFIENQAPDSPNPHEKLDNVTSAGEIIRHVLDGVELARKYHIPNRIQDFIREHHGTMIARYQYANAVKAADGDESKVDVEKFRYPGPRPRSRETAILMLADGCEARVRAERPKDEDELRRIIRSVIDHRVAERQLDETNLTLKDLDTLVDSFCTTLRGMYHPRIEYPKLDAPQPAEPAALPVASPLNEPTQPAKRG